MTTVFFKVNDVQEKEMKQFMKEEGYSNKAEFFRFLIKFYKYHKTDEQKRFDQISKELDETVRKALKSEEFRKRIQTPLEEQLKDV